MTQDSDGPRTLKALRDAAPETDRAEPALTPSPAPPHHDNPNSRYVRVEYRASTLDELRHRCGEHGAAAVEEAVHGAILSWLMMRAESTRQELVALSANWTDQRERLGAPRFSREPWRSPLRRMPEAEREAVRGTAKRLLAEWQGAGCPGLTGHIQDAHQHIHSASITEAQRQIARAAVADHFKGEADAAHQ